jgi:hypothetical protein
MVMRFMGLDSEFFEKVFVAFDGGLEASDNLCAADTVPVVTIAAVGLGFGKSANEDREPAVGKSDQVMQCFFHGYRLGERGERVKEKNKLILKAGRKGRIHWGKRGEINSRKTTGEGENRIFESGRAGKTRLAKGYLGLQGSDDETGAMDES